jgi:hypothetical protein
MNLLTLNRRRLSPEPPRQRIAIIGSSRSQNKIHLELKDVSRRKGNRGISRCTLKMSQGELLTLSPFERDSKFAFFDLFFSPDLGEINRRANQTVEKRRCWDLGY